MSMNRAAHFSSAPDAQQQQQQSRRRSARHLDEHEEEGRPPSKRLKGNTAGNDAPGGGRANGHTAAGKKGKKMYDEADDGFAFSRAKTRKGAATRTEEARKVSSTSDGSNRVASDSAPGEVKKRPRKTLPVSPPQDDVRATQPRRSKRLSGDQVDERTARLEDPFTTKAQSTRHEVPAARRPRDASPILDNGMPGSLHVPKKRGTKIDLILAETPVIRRNKAMRQTSHDATGQRRSSAGLRGKRASSLIDAGSSSAMPHAEVEEKDFYKHIGQEIMEPRRMKQLLVWCATRAIGPAARDGEPDTVRTIQEGLLTDFAARNELSNWFDRQDDVPADVVQERVEDQQKKPNPRNVQNAAKLAELEAELERLQAEKAAWDNLMSHGPSRTTPSSTQQQPQSQPDPSTAPQTLDPSQIDASLLAPSQAEILSTLLRAHDPNEPNLLLPGSSVQPGNNSTGTNPGGSQISTCAAIQHRLDRAADGLEFKVDLYRDSVHRLERYVDTAGRVADRLLAGVAARLEDADPRTTTGSGGVAVGAGDAGAPTVREGDALRALARVLGRKEG